MYLFLTSVPMVWDLKETLTESLRRTSEEAMSKKEKKNFIEHFNSLMGCKDEKE